MSYIENGMKQTTANKLIMVVLYMAGISLVILLRIENRASLVIAIRINIFPFKEIVLFDETDELYTLTITRPAKTNIIPIILFSEGFSFKIKNASKPTIAGEALVIKPLSIADVYFNPKKRKTLNKKTPVRDWRNRTVSIFILILGICFLFMKVNNESITEAIIRLHSDAKKTGSVCTNNLLATTELPAINIAKVSSV